MNRLQDVVLVQQDGEATPVVCRTERLLNEEETLRTESRPTVEDSMLALLLPVFSVFVNRDGSNVSQID